MTPGTCGTCRFCRKYEDGALGPRHLCHEAPPTMMVDRHKGQIGAQMAVVDLQAVQLTSRFPIVNPGDPTFWCGRFQRRGRLAAILRFLKG